MPKRYRKKIIVTASQQYVSLRAPLWLLLEKLANLVYSGGECPPGGSDNRDEALDAWQHPFLRPAKRCRCSPVVMDARGGRMRKRRRRLSDLVAFLH